MRRLAVRIVQPNRSTDTLLFQDPTAPEKQFRILMQPGHAPHCTTRLHTENDCERPSADTPFPFPHIRLCPFKPILSSKAYSWAGAVLVLLSFTLGDLRDLALPGAADDFVDCIMLAIVFLFLVDVGVKTMARGKYRWTFAFWMDVVATIGLVAQVHFATNDFLSECESHYFHRLLIIARAARLSGSASQLIRFLTAKSAERPKRNSSYSISLRPSIAYKVKQMRAVHPASTFSEDQMKFSPTFSRTIGAEPSDENVQSIDLREGTFEKLYHVGTASIRRNRCSVTQITEMNESRLSKHVTMQIVSLLVFVVIALSVFSWVTIPPSADASQQFGLKLLKEAESTPRFKEIVEEYVNFHKEEGRLDALVKLSAGAEILWESGYETSHRTDLCYVSLNDYTAVFSIHTKTQAFAVFDLCTTFLLCVLLLVTCLELSTLIRYKVLFPLEKMIQTVRQMAMNPLSFVKNTKSINEEGKRNSFCCGVTANYAEAEIKALEYAFRKIGVMLALVYGSAGSEIITNTLSLESDFGSLNPGKKALAIFCFAKIGAFDVLLECLGTKILQYVNVVSSLIHSVSEKFLGSVNRNLGDAYLLVWKFPGRDLLTVKEQVILNPFSTEVKTASSIALLFAVKSVAKLARSHQLFSFKRHIGQIDSKVSFGFHVGWAFEGAIGSPFKIDASYLSPHVNLASRIESVTKQYGVTILMSGEMYVRLDEEVKRFNRLIDTVRLKGVAEPVGLYCFDLDPSGLTIKRSRLEKRKIERKRARLKAALENGRITVSQMFTESRTIAGLRTKYPKSFFTSYAQAYSLYIAGKWCESAKLLKSECLSILPQDGPARTLLGFMEELDCAAPTDWSGFRELHSK